MLAHNKSGWTLLEYLKVSEDDIGDFDNVTGSFAVISVNGEYLIGFNSWRQQWEFPAGGIEPGETAREAAIRELYEETHQRQTDLEFKGLFKIKDPKGTIKYQAVFYGTMPTLAPFSHIAEDEMDKIRLWDFKEDIGYVDECDLKIVELVTGNMNNPETSFTIRQKSARDMLSLWNYSNYSEATPTARFFYDNIESGNAIFWSLCDEENIVGELYSFLELEDKDFADGKDIAYLCAFRVNKEYRGKGYGSMLMNTALSDLKSKNFSLATIGVGMDEEGNKKMYDHMGFNRKIKECFFDPCARDKDMKPAADEGFILMSKEL